MVVVVPVLLVPVLLVVVPPHDGFMQASVAKH